MLAMNVGTVEIKLNQQPVFPHSFKRGSAGSTGQGWLRHHIPVELRRRPRGLKAGAELKAKQEDHQRHYRPSVPSIIMGNLSSLLNKI